MKPGVYYTSRNRAIKLLNKFDLLNNAIYIEEDISQEFIDSMRRKKYFEAYRIAIKNFDYHLLLFDESFLQFEYKKDTEGLLLRYSFFEFPFDFPSYRDYLELGGLSFNKVGYELKDQYEQELFESDKKNEFALIRYDYSEKYYSHGTHSASHFHIGKVNSIRISSCKLITPLLFIVFILKQVYENEWKKLIKISDFLTEYQGLKGKCNNINNCFFNELDKEELYLI